MLKSDGTDGLCMARKRWNCIHYLSGRTSIHILYTPYWHMGIKNGTNINYMHVRLAGMYWWYIFSSHEQKNFLYVGTDFFPLEL